MVCMDCVYVLFFSRFCYHIYFDVFFADLATVLASTLKSSSGPIYPPLSYRIGWKKQRAQDIYCKFYGMDHVGICGKYTRAYPHVSSSNLHFFFHL